jgi:hypothetical protein
VEVLISAGKAGRSDDLASLRAWLDAAGIDVPWDLAPERPASGTLGSGADEICAVITALEGLPPLLQWIKSWRESKQESPSITVVITIAGNSPQEDSRNNIPAGEPAIDNGESAGHDHEPDA